MNDKTNLPLKYWKKAVMNSIKNEYRQNANNAKHIVAVGLDLTPYEKAEAGIKSEFDDYLTLKGVDDWLMCIEDEALHYALNQLSRLEQILVYAHYVRDDPQVLLGDCLGIGQAAISRKMGRIRKKIKRIYGKCNLK